MPKVTLTERQRMDRAFMAALRYGQELRGEDDADAVRLLQINVRTYKRKLDDPGSFSLEAIRRINRYFNDRQLCEAFGVEYHGSTPA